MAIYLDRFATFLEHSERSPLTIRNYLCDLDAFATWFKQTNGDDLGRRDCSCDRMP